MVPRIPFDRPTVLDEKVESRYLDSKNSAVRRMRQVIGRGLRTPDASCTIYILDERYKKLGQFLPQRFKDRWLEGGRDIGKLIEAERRRNHAIRDKALAHYGCKCRACDLAPRHPSMIDIHHLFPISQGERQTTLADVIPLCANCHRLAHTEEPPIPLERLRELMDDNATKFA
jgi:5-methylcytosine-specific restriction endonuclease McrA